MHKKILIIGANGFIGSGLVTRILADTDSEVFCVDLSTNKLSHCLGHDRFRFYDLDITIQHEAIEALLKKCDIVFPLAAIANPRMYVTNPIEVFELDFEANLRIIKWCVKHGKRLIFPSTSEVYGMSGETSFNEDTTNFVLGPISKQRWIYSCSKQLLDRVIYAYGEKNQLDYSIFRPFNFIGPKLDDIKSVNNSRSITQFLHNIFNKKPIKLVDGGKSKRCFTFIDDGIDALMRILENKNGNASKRIFNIGNPKENYSLKEVANITVEVLSEFDKDLAQSVAIEDVSAKDYYGESYQDVENRTPCIKSTQTLLNWDPKICLKDAIRNTINFHVNGIDKDAEMLKCSKK